VRIGCTIIVNLLKVKDFTERQAEENKIPCKSLVHVYPLLVHSDDSIPDNNKHKELTALLCENCWCNCLVNHLVHYLLVATYMHILFLPIKPKMVYHLLEHAC
jgi:hypothetical protein